MAAGHHFHCRSLHLGDERFIRLLQTYGIRRLVDIRTIPRSRDNPQFNDTVLASSLVAAHLGMCIVQRWVV